MSCESPRSIWQVHASSLAVSVFSVVLEFTNELTSISMAIYSRGPSSHKSSFENSGALELNHNISTYCRDILQMNMKGGKQHAAFLVRQELTQLLKYGTALLKI